ncbi:sensor histidine kinase [Georgenia thermotolerans]|uniref:histidine kinase n=1 Tax=Georgenia thermotolerans TaxID=527326 RepID=A0A7J5UPU3_9MICO|nr:sensor histidine kinase [Georgenia thermotolerans]KAE8764251.1 sensor histidine kinase [Georgenia thermotolerans]
MERRQPWNSVTDLVVAGLVATVGLVEVWVPLVSASGSGSRVVSSAGIVAFAAFLTQRRTRPAVSLLALLVWPVIGVLTGGSVQILFFGQLVPLTFLVYSVARHGRGRVVWVGLLAAAAFMALADLTIEWLQEPGEIIFHWGFLVLASLIGRGLRLSEDRAVAAALRAAEVETTSRERTLAALADEQARIARELHDVVAHSVSVMVVQAGAAEQVVADDPRHVREALATIRTTGTGALAEMRRVVAMLRQPDAAGELAPQPDVAGLPSLVEQARAPGLAVDLEVHGTPVALPAGLGLAVYRIAQEALTNVRRHAAASHARVLLRYGPGALELEVTDNGHGGPATAPHGSAGHGLIGMRERASMYGGRLETTATPGGYTVRAVLPVAGP